MHPYSFIVSLRANHPSRDLSFLSHLFSIERRHGWTAGDERKTPRGTLLGGTRQESYWSGRVTSEKVSSEEWQLEDILHQSVIKVLRYQAELAEFFETGGTMNYFIALYGSQNYGLIFSPGLMSKLTEAKVEIQLDIYPSQSAA